MGVVLMISALALPASAYHSTSQLSGVGTSWGSFFPANGQLTLCEDPDPTTGNPGFGGFCYMSTDLDDLDASAGANPDDWYIGGAPQDVYDVEANDTWSCVRIDPASDATGVYRVGTNAHSMAVLAGGWFYYKELLADWISDGHVEFLADPGAGGLGVWGYEADFDCAPPAGATCNGPTGTNTFRMDTVCTYYPTCALDDSTDELPRDCPAYSFGPVVIRRNSGTTAPVLAQSQPGCTVFSSTATSMRVTCSPPVPENEDWKCQNPGLVADLSAGTSVTGNTWCTNGPTASATDTTAGNGHEWSGIATGLWDFAWYCEAIFAGASTGYVLCDAPDPPLIWPL